MMSAQAMNMNCSLLFFYGKDSRRGSYCFFLYKEEILHSYIICTHNPTRTTQKVWSRVRARIRSKKMNKMKLLTYQRSARKESMRAEWFLLVLCCSSPKSSLNLRSQELMEGSTLLKCLLFLSFHTLQAATRKMSRYKGPLQESLVVCNTCRRQLNLGQMIPSWLQQAWLKGHVKIIWSTVSSSGPPQRRQLWSSPMS